MRRTFIALGLAALVAGAGSTGAGAAQADGARQTAAGTSTRSVMQCATVLEPVAPGSRDLRIKTDFCSTDEEAVRSVVPAASLVLVRFYGGFKYTGAYRTMWVPSPCDSVGYHVTDNRALNSAVGGIASVQLGNAGCTYLQAFSGTSFSGSVLSGYIGIPKLTGATLYHLWSAKMWLQELPCAKANAAC